jgi:hypothetical protein
VVLLSGLEAIQSSVFKWAQCNGCNKWRKLPSHVDTSSLPRRWFCRLNEWDEAKRSCEAEEELSDDDDDDDDDSDGGAAAQSIKGAASAVATVAVAMADEDDGNNTQQMRGGNRRRHGRAGESDGGSSSSGGVEGNKIDKGVVEILYGDGDWYRGRVIGEVPAGLKVYKHHHYHHRQH